MDSYWPHHAETYQVTGHRSSAAIAATAAHAFSRNHQPTAAASAMSAMLAGSFIRAEMAGSDASVTVRNAGSTPGQRAPDPGHDGRERQVLVVGVPEAVDRDAVDPQHELVDVAGEAARGPDPHPERDARREQRRDGEHEQDPGDGGAPAADDHPAVVMPGRRAAGPGGHRRQAGVVTQ